MAKKAARRRPPPVELGRALLHHRYLAVTSVDQLGDHFTIWAHHIEPAMWTFRVLRNASGPSEIETESSYWGGFGVGPSKVPNVPSEAQGLGRELEARFRASCPGITRLRMAYGGSYRQVRLIEFALEPAANGHAVGWYSQRTFAMDATLGKVLETVESESGFGFVQVPGDAQWLPSSGSRDTALTTANALPDALVPEVAEAARRYDAGTPPVEVESLVPAGEPVIPPGASVALTFKVSLYRRLLRAPTSAEADLTTSLELRDAVFGTGASGIARATLDGRSFELRATLTPAAPRLPTPGYRKVPYTGELRVHVEDDRGSTFEHTYRASGQIELDGDGVLTTALVIPGASAPSPAEAARHGRLPGLDKHSYVELVVGLDLMRDPRHRAEP